MQDLLSHLQEPVCGGKKVAFSFSKSWKFIHSCRFGYNTPPDYQDNEGFCGGQTVQWSQNGGKCGLCGDAYNGIREHEYGGRLAKLKSY